MPKNADTSVEPISPRLIGVAEALSLAAATAATVTQARFAIGRRMGSNFEEISAKTGTAAHSIQQELLDKLSQLSDSPAAHDKGLAEKIGAIYKQHEKNVKGYWADRHITTVGAKLISFKPHQRLEMLFGSIAVFTVSLGVAIGFAKSEQVRGFFTRHGHPAQGVPAPRN